MKFVIGTIIGLALLISQGSGALSGAMETLKAGPQANMGSYSSAMEVNINTVGDNYECTNGFLKLGDC